MAKSSSELRKLIDETLRAHEAFLERGDGCCGAHLKVEEGRVLQGSVMDAVLSAEPDTSVLSLAVDALVKSAPTLAQELRIARRRNKKLRRQLGDLRKQIDDLLIEIEETFRGGKHKGRVAATPATGIEILRLIHGYVVLQNSAAHSFSVWREAVEAWGNGEIEATSVHDAGRKHLERFGKGDR